MTVDRATGDVVSEVRAVVRPPPTRASSPTRTCSTLVESYRQARGPAGQQGRRLHGHELDNEAVDRIAVDAQRAFAGADIAFLNSGNTRSDIDAGPITYSDAFEVQAYEHPVWRMHLDGCDLIAARRDQPNLLVSGPSRRCARTSSTRSPPTASWLGRPPFDHGTDREKVGTDLQALVAWLQRHRRV